MTKQTRRSPPYSLHSRSTQSRNATLRWRQVLRSKVTCKSCKYLGGTTLATVIRQTEAQLAKQGRPAASFSDLEQTPLTCHACGYPDGSVPLKTIIAQIQAETDDACRKSLNAFVQKATAFLKAATHEPPTTPFTFDASAAADEPIECRKCDQTGLDCDMHVFLKLMHFHLHLAFPEKYVELLKHYVDQLADDCSKELKHAFDDVLEFTKDLKQTPTIRNVLINRCNAFGIIDPLYLILEGDVRDALTRQEALATVFQTIQRTLVART